MGIHHSPVDVLIMDKQTKEKYQLGDDEVKPVLAGKKDVRKWRILWRGTYMPFPYSYNEEENKLLLFGLEQHENLGRYLIENKNALENRKFFRKKITEYGKKWYELWNPHWFEGPKIITPDISEKNNFTYDENYFVNVDIYTMKLLLHKEDSSKPIDIKEITSKWPKNGLIIGQGFYDKIDFDEEIKKISLIPILRGETDSGKLKEHICEYQEVIIDLE